MKRSEMLKIIEMGIDRACGNDGQQRLYPDDSYLAFAILKRIEEVGMAPPGYYKPVPFESDGKQYPLVPGDFKINGIWCTPDQKEWEPE